MSFARYVTRFALAGALTTLGATHGLSMLATARAAEPPATAAAASGGEKQVGLLPIGADGKPLNLDFETGDLRDWTATGDAFKDQPIKGEIDKNRTFGEGKKSRLQGQFWIGGYEKYQDRPTGTLTSAPFKVTQPFCAFRVGGGSLKGCRVELVLKENGKVFSSSQGVNEEDMLPVVVDLRNQVGHEMFIRIVDEERGGWGHVNFDDFKLYKGKPFFDRTGLPSKQDEYEFAGLPPDDAAAAMKMPPGFKAIAFAGEPDVHQPIAQAIDDRGRIWIAEAYQYPERAKGDKGRDRIIIFEDTDGDGKFNKRTTFIEGLNLVSGLEVGFGGVWVGAAPYLMFIPDKDGDDKPDSAPQILLDGWAYQDTHEVLNTFNWGPDGWLYGCHGVFTHSRVGKPGTPDKDRTPLNCAIWRYHPTRHVFEAFMNGTSNPWGVDFDDHGNSFLTSCVIPHLYHVIQGARYERQGGEHFNKYTYDDIKTIADHRHYVGANPHAGNNRSDEAGGGHAHAGAMVYLGGTWPAEFRGKIFMNNIHGQRINMDILNPKGSGWVGSHGHDFCLTNDRWSQILNLQYGPDGNVFMIDWYDANACHHTNVEGHDRTNGRIFKVVHNGGLDKPYAGRLSALPLARRSDIELANLMEDKNDWWVRHARRLLQERSLTRKIDANAIAALEMIAKKPGDDTRQLRALWALHVIDVSSQQRAAEDAPVLSDAVLIAALADQSPYVRGWAMQLWAEARKSLGVEVKGRTTSPQLLAALARVASSDAAPVTRRFAASLAIASPLDVRAKMLAGLVQHSEDATDQNLPYLYWYALEPVAGANPALGLQIAGSSKIPMLLEFTVRRIASSGSPDGLATLVDYLGKQEAADRQLTVLSGLNAAMQGRRKVEAPKAFGDVYAKLARANNTAVMSQMRQLAVTFGDASVQTAMRDILADKTAEAAMRSDALASLVKAKDAKLPEVLLKILDEPALRSAAIRALAVYDEPRTSAVLLAAYAKLSPDDRRAALATLASRKTYAHALVEAIAKKTVAATDISADLARQLRNFGDPQINDALDKYWGTIRESAADRLQMIADYKKMLATPANTTVDVAHGRAVFAKTCAQCHTLFGTGGKVGPDLTGSNRSNLDYALSNVLDPSAVMAKEYMPTLIRTVDGRQITGIIKMEDANAVTIQTAEELLVLPKEDIDERKASTKSMMPEDLLKPLKPIEVRSLIAYLASPTQTPMAATPENIQGFFNGKDLKGWVADPKLWSVENGELVGRTEGLKQNNWIKSELLLDDFHFKCQVKLVKNEGNSGIQFRSEALPDGEVKGYQADIGVGWWGKLYEEHGRGLVWDKSGEEFLKPGEWNTYEIIASGSRIRTLLNGKVCVDIDDPKGARRGVIALQLHAGGPTEVRYKDFSIEFNPSLKLEHTELEKIQESLRLLEPQLNDARKKMGEFDRATRKDGGKNAEIARQYANYVALTASLSKDIDALYARRDLLVTGKRISSVSFPSSKPLQSGQTIKWKTMTLDDKFRSEGVCAGDFNKDGKLDIAAGNVWFEAPSWKMHPIEEKPETFDPKVYSHSFVNAADDINGDGWLDVVVVDFPGTPTWWFENPKGADRPWAKHKMFDVTNNESPDYVDVDGDGKRDLLHAWLPDNYMGYAVRPTNPADPWHEVAISTAKAPGTDKFSHGLGLGDINGDGRKDVVITNGWWQAPKDRASKEPWKFHPVNFGQACSQMLVYDFDGDGDNDVLSSSAHAFGIWWYEQVKNGKEVTWTTHEIDKSYSETHANVLADINGDGLPDFVTGKRWWSHAGGGPGGDQPAVLYWNELQRKDGKPVWTRHEIDPQQTSGVGTAFEVVDMNADGLLDVIISNKKGSFYFEQVRE
jgi:putative membrane-bound dehydrogenase-like protein